MPGEPIAEGDDDMVNGTDRRRARGLGDAPLDDDERALLSRYRATLDARLQHTGAEDRVLARIKARAVDPRVDEERRRRPWVVAGLLAAAAVTALVSRALLVTMASPDVADTVPQAPFTVEERAEERAEEPEALTTHRAPAPSITAPPASEALRDASTPSREDERETSSTRRTKRLSRPTPPPAQDSKEEVDDGTASASSRIAAELKLIQAAERAQRDGDYARALERLREHEATFPNGQLFQEREASRISALCRLGGANAARAAELAADFLRRWPSSHLARRVRLACPDQP